eukprot:c12959_g1_i2.p1 GENE.c12959_g1_i2~~c12959_g1_i2.p1  ORF type:complete len:391 (-),score=85.43 c12959_g1_i2:440-1585(-)
MVPTMVPPPIAAAKAPTTTLIPTPATTASDTALPLPTAPLLTAPTTIVQTITPPTIAPTTPTMTSTSSDSSTPAHVLSEIVVKGRLGVRSIVQRLSEIRKEIVSGEMPKPGDFVLWDARMVHSTGEPQAFNHSHTVRQVFYCAFMVAHENMDRAVTQMECRDTGVHPPWAPKSHADIEKKNYEAYELSNHGRNVYLYDSDKSQPIRSHRSARLRNTVAVEAPHKVDISQFMTEREILFFRRYGFVVIQGVVPKHMVQNLREQIATKVKEISQVDILSPLESMHIGMSVASLAKVIGPHGAGMVELYWLPAMEAVRELPELHAIASRLFNETWGSQKVPAFVRPRNSEREEISNTTKLALYVDRTNIRIPACVLAKAMIECS